MIKRSAVAVCVLVLALASAGTLPAASTSSDLFTPILQQVLAAPHAVFASDGRYHVVYEVQALNASSLPWTVQSITIRGLPFLRTQARWSGSQVSDVLVSLADRKATNRIEPGQGAIFYLTFSVASKQALPSVLGEELSLANASNPLQGPPAVTEAGGVTGVVNRPPPTLGPPLVGGNWVAADGCCTAPRHVRAAAPYNGKLYNPQRFAIDWEQLDAQGRLFTGDKRQLTNWPGYGKPVLAVADGVIVHAVNNQPNQVPGGVAGVTPDAADGNGVILRLDDGRYAVYGHMVPGSVTVHTGDRVRRGQRIGSVGNSGNSFAPHLHLHVVDRDALLAANGLPYVFDSFDVTAKVASTAAFDHAEATGEPAQLAPVRTGARHHALPLDQLVLTWK